MNRLMFGPVRSLQFKRLISAAAGALAAFGGTATAKTLEIAADAPFWMHAGADALLYLHIGGGSIGLVSGATALLTRKGERLHRLAGNVFFVSMLTMAAVGAGVAPFLPERISSLAGFLTFHLVATSWMTVRRREGAIGRFETGAFFGALAILGAAVVLGMIARPTGAIDGQPAEILIPLGVVAAIAATGDLKVVLQRGISGRARIARHLWRMCFALFVAAGSLFLGQPQVFPEWLRGSPIMIALSAAPLLAMLFWLSVVLLTRRFRGPAAA